MNSLEVLSKKTFSTEKMQKVNLFETENMFCDLYCVLPGQAQKLHRHQGADKIYYVLEGSGTFQIGEEERVLGQGMVLLAPSDVDHGVRNASQKNLCLLVVMAPNPNNA
jgi:mannose-6-phosphate isomerase-like protein (cupin superfamily)